jgi:hypothetical protein
VVDLPLDILSPQDPVTEFETGDNRRRRRVSDARCRVSVDLERQGHFSCRETTPESRFGDEEPTQRSRGKRSYELALQPLDVGNIRCAPLDGCGSEQRA